MRVTQKASRIQALEHYRRGGMVSFSPSGNHAYTIRNSSESDLMHRLCEGVYEPYLVTGVSMDEVRDKLLAEFPLHQVLSVNGTEYSVRKVGREGDEMIVSLEARENQPHAYMSVRIGFTVWEN